MADAVVSTAVARPRERPLKAADIAASARRKLTKGAILMASLGPIPVIRPHVLSQSRPPQHFASVSGDEIKGGRLGANGTAGAAPEDRRLTRR